MKKTLTAIVCLFVMLFAMIPTSLAHKGDCKFTEPREWIVEATCRTNGVRRYQCSYGDCGKHNDLTVAAFGHPDSIFLPATCTKPRICKYAAIAGCGQSRGGPEGHSMSKATCISSSKCTKCGYDSKKMGDHEWQEATCKKPSECKHCHTKLGNKSVCIKNPKTGKCKWCGKKMK